MKRELRRLLAEKQFEEIARVAEKKKRVLGVLVSLTYDADRLIAWRAAEAQGWAAARISRTNPEFVRSHLRRLHWLLSEESGGICPLAPQAMAEIVARTGGDVADYAPITVNLITDMAKEDLDAGFRVAVLWAIGRLAGVARAAVEPVLPEVERWLGDPDPTVRGLAAWSISRAGHPELAARHRVAEGDRTPVEIYQDGDFQTAGPGEPFGNP